MLGVFDLTPCREIAFDRRVWDGAVMPAGHTISVGRVSLDQPIADSEIRVRAKAKESALPGTRAPILALRFKRGERFRVGDIAEAAAALLAFVVFKVQKLPAILAFE